LTVKLIKDSTMAGNVVGEHDEWKGGLVKMLSTKN
jgi:hypothetical protein